MRIEATAFIARPETSVTRKAYAYVYDANRIQEELVEEGGSCEEHEGTG
jgi:hypothetical protein